MTCLIAPVCDTLFPGFLILLLYWETVNCQVEELPCLYFSANLGKKQPNVDHPDEAQVTALLGY